jgi:hypothetical protein
MSEQQNDVFCKGRTQAKFTPTSEFYVDTEGLTYHSQRAHVPQIVIPKNLQKTMIEKHQITTQ